MKSSVKNGRFVRGIQYTYLFSLDKPDFVEKIAERQCKLFVL